jgi:HlyD family secretion protein
MAMDVKRDPAILKRKQRNRLIGGVIAVAAVIGLTVAVSQLQPAAPTVAGSAVYTGTVKRGPMVREVRGAGTLVPEDIRWISTTATGKVEKLVLRAGAEVKPGTVILELSNPDIKQQVSDAELAWKAAVAQLENARSNQATSRMSQESAASDAQGAYLVAQSDLEANKILNAQGIVADQQIKVKQQTVDSAKNRLELAKKQLQVLLETEKSQLAPQEAAVSSARARYDQLARQLSDLSVRSNMSGLLQAVPVEVGQQVGPGTNLARVSDPQRLKAEIRISETQTRDLAVGQLAKIDTRNGVIKGHVTRIDPASAGGTVGVDVTLDEALPLGARPDQSVDGVIELQRLENVLFVESPTFGQENSTVMLFKFTTPTEAERTAVKLGRRSVSFVEVIDGLKEGDRVILSDMQQYDGHQRLRIN